MRNIFVKAVLKEILSAPKQQLKDSHRTTQMILDPVLENLPLINILMKICNGVGYKEMDGRRVKKKKEED